MPRTTRFLFVALMIVLLPLRGWAGNIMAVEMASMAFAQAGVAIDASQTAMPADCPMLSQLSSGAGDQNEAALPAGCNCDTCELCLAVANLADISWSASPLLRHSSPPAFSTRFISAISALNFKPPIA